MLGRVALPARRSVAAVARSARPARAYHAAVPLASKAAGEGLNRYSRNVTQSKAQGASQVGAPICG